MEVSNVSRQEAAKVLERLREQNLVPASSDNDEAIIAVIGAAIEAAFQDGNDCAKTMSFLSQITGR